MQNTTPYGSTSHMHTLCCAWLVCLRVQLNLYITTVSEASCIKSCLDKYCRWFGQSINNSKSSTRFSKNTDPSISEAISNILPCTFNASKSLYLGLPIFMGNSKKRAFQDIIDKLLSRIEGWRAKTLSQASKLVLIKSVVAALPSYAMSSFLLPNSFCSKLDRIFKNFWWGFPSNKSRILYLKAWDSLSPKGFGWSRLQENERTEFGPHLQAWLETSH